MAAKDNKSPFAIDLLELSQEFNNYTGRKTFESKNKSDTKICHTCFRGQWNRCFGGISGSYFQHVFQGN